MRLHQGNASLKVQMHRSEKNMFMLHKCDISVLDHFFSLIYYSCLIDVGVLKVKRASERKANC